MSTPLSPRELKLVLDEREECAKVAADFASAPEWIHSTTNYTAPMIAAAIRSRPQPSAPERICGNIPQLPPALGELKLVRPIIGIESRTAQEVFDIMCDRIRSRPQPSAPSDATTSTLDLNGPGVVRHPAPHAAPPMSGNYVVVKTPPSAAEQGGECECFMCWKSRNPTGLRDRMFLCPVCGNKRCPRATSHTNECTNSNEPGQRGSEYGPPPALGELIGRLEEAADRVAKRAMGHDAPALISIPRAETDVDAIIIEATRALRSLHEENERLREALKPFAAAADEWDEMGDTRPVSEGIVVSDLRRARSQVKEGK